MSGVPPLLPSPSRLWKSHEVAEALAISVRQLWRLVAQGVVPAPIRIGKRTVRWRPDALRELLGESITGKLTHE